jgi:hypothetical protein
METNHALAEVLLSEGLIPVGSLPSILPASRSGRPLARAAVWRWISKGLPGPDGMRVRLEAVRLGRRWMTSRQALARFMARTTRSADATRPPAASAPAPARLLPFTVATLAARGFDVSKFGGGS